MKSSPNILNIKLYNMSAEMTCVECPICMDEIVNINNRVTTECGHCFHTNCLMTSVAHNGFGCPYCRSKMAEAPEEEEEEDWEEEDEELYDDYALRGLRFFTNNLTGIEHEEEDLEEEEDEANDDDEDIPEEQENKPTPAFVTEKLTAQGVTMEDLVKCMLMNHGEYDSNEEEFNTVDNVVFGKLRIIISNYRPEPVSEPVSAPVIVSLDTMAQPKINTHPRIPLFMIHV